MKNVNGKHIVVIGVARSGTAIAKLLHKKGAEVFVSDHESIATNFKKQLVEAGIAFEENGHTERAEKADFAVISPGVPTKSPLVQAYLQTGRKVVSEIEAASWFNKGPITAVTGSNGKTTVTNWLDHIWSLAGREHITAGNVGRAFSGSVEKSAADKDTILEVSSFQLDHIEEFHPKISLLLNITADHLDRYENKLENYAASKFRITENQTDKDWLIYHYDDENIQKGISKLKKKVNGPGCLLFQAGKKFLKALLFETEKLSLN